MRRRQLIVAILLSALFVAPLLLYCATFGLLPTTNHTRWSEFGSAIGGIYTPILALATLFVIAVQAGMQRELNNHQYDQAYLTQSRSDLEFYTLRMLQHIEQTSLNGPRLGDHLQEYFHPKSRDELTKDPLTSVAKQLDFVHPQALATWMAIYLTLEVLYTNKATATYNIALVGSIRKLVAVLSYETCMALDNYHETLTAGTLNTNYQFSALLKASSEA